MDLIEGLYNRKSIRKYKDETIPKEDLTQILEAALQAPSAKNMQNWHLVVIEDQEKINEVASIIKKKHQLIIDKIDNIERTKRFEKMIHYYTFFEKAPVLVLVYASSYHSSSSDYLKEINLMEDYQYHLDAAPGIQNIGALMQNLLLAAHSLGYGSCWMTGPNFAIKEIEAAVNLEHEGYHLVAMTPLGVPEDTKHPSPTRESVENKVTYIYKE